MADVKFRKYSSIFHCKRSATAYKLKACIKKWMDQQITMVSRFFFWVSSCTFLFSLQNHFSNQRDILRTIILNILHFSFCVYLFIRKMIRIEIYWLIRNHQDDFEAIDCKSWKCEISIFTLNNKQKSCFKGAFRTLKPVPNRRFFLMLWKKQIMTDENLMFRNRTLFYPCYLRRFMVIKTCILLKRCPWTPAEIPMSQFV